MSLKIIAAAKRGEVEKVKALSAFVHQREWDRRTALHCACQEGHLEVVKVLLQSGANIDSRDVMGLTSLHLAAMYGKADVVEFLLQNEANSYIQDKFGAKPLGTVCTNGNQEHYRTISKMLLRQAKYYSPGSFEPEDIFPKPALLSGLTASNPNSLLPLIKAPAVVPANPVRSRLHPKEPTKSKGQTTNKPGETVMGALEKNKNPINQKSIKPKSPELDSGRPLFAKSGPKKG